MDEGVCQISGRSLPRSQLIAASSIRDSLRQLIQADRPDFSDASFISVAELNRYRQRYMRQLLTAERGEVTQLEQEVLDALHQAETLSRNLEVEAAEARTYGQRIADAVARFGGSWKFILGFFSFLVLWMEVNIFVLVTRPFDPYPFILLNLVLSCLAAIQAPIIRMSQNRREAKDRMRSLHDYQVNLKAELELPAPAASEQPFQRVSIPKTKSRRAPYSERRRSSPNSAMPFGPESCTYP